jgi:hypothetical protein
MIVKAAGEDTGHGATQRLLANLNNEAVLFHTLIQVRPNDGKHF